MLPVQPVADAGAPMTAAILHATAVPTGMQLKAHSTRVEPEAQPGEGEPGEEQPDARTLVTAARPALQRQEPEAVRRLSTVFLLRALSRLSLQSTPGQELGRDDESSRERQEC